MTKIASAWLALSLALPAVVIAESSDETLSVTNGDFSDLTGLQERAGGWYAGVPSGWTAAASSEGLTD